MTRLIRLKDKEIFDSLEGMDGKEYEDFLKRKLEETKKDPFYSKFSFVTKNQLFRFFAYPPELRDIENKIVLDKYKETEEQREARLKLRNYYKEICYNKVGTSLPQEDNSYTTREGGIVLSTVLELLDISNKTLDNLQDRNGENNFETFKIKKKKYVDEKSLLEYLNSRHFENTDLGLEGMYKEVDSLKLHKKEETVAKKKLEKIINSKEYKQKWEKYFKSVPEKQRVYRNLNKIKSDGIDIYYRGETHDNFDIYNPNIKVCDEKITKVPKLYPANYWALLLGLEVRSIYRYCDRGYLKHYRVGKKLMISVEDFDESQDKIKEKKTSTRMNSGRKRKIEFIFSDKIFEKKEFREYLKAHGFEEMEALFKDKQVIEKVIEEKEKELKKQYNEELEKDIEKYERSLKRVSNSISKERRLAMKKLIADNEFFDLIKKDIDDYYNDLKKLKGYKEDRDKHSDDGEIVKQLSYIIKEYEGKLEKQRENIFSKFLNH